MLDRNELTTKLKNSPSAESLRAEVAIATALRELRWTVDHGPYYLDPATHKMREIDVVGRQFWRRASKHGDRMSHVHFIVESKTMKGWHLLFQPVMPVKRLDHRFEFWFGWTVDFESRRLIDALGELRMSTDEIVQILPRLRDLQQRTAGDEFSPFGLDVPAPRHRATSFRETNTEKEKEELDQSVLWRAMQGVLSAVQSLQNAWFEKEISDIDFGLLASEYLPTDRVEQTVAAASEAMRHTCHFHPVVVVHAALYVLRPRHVQKVPWIRLEQRALTGDLDRWVDVVDAASFAAYAKYITATYAQRLRSEGYSMRGARRRRSTRLN